MGELTKIEWCDHSWSPWRGCTKVSPGCANCYAETLSKRNPAVLGQWGKGKPRVLAKNWNEPVLWQRAWEKKAEEAEQFDWACPPNPTVFPSLCDWLDDEVDSVWLYEFIKLIIKTPELTWLLLTKRPENFVSRLRAAQASCTVDPLDIVDRIDAWISGDRIPLNVWVGTSVEDQIRANERIPALLRIPAVGRFLSVEPLLGQVRLDCYECGTTESEGGMTLFGNALNGFQATSGYSGVTGPKVDWVIIGGESGHGARPCNVEWIRSLVRQCLASKAPVFVKQLGARPMVNWPMAGDDGAPGLIEVGKQIAFTCASGAASGSVKAFSHPKGGDPAEWPYDLNIRQFPEGLR